MSSYCNSCFWDGYRLSNVRRVIHWALHLILKCIFKKQDGPDEMDKSLLLLCIIIDMIFRFPSWNQR